jgi:anaerobic selenocysteine-containing dehydrogenase
VAFAQYLDSSDSSYIVPKEAIDTQLLQAIACAHKDQALIASAQNSLSTQEQKQLPTLEKKEANRMKKEDGNFFERKFGRRSFLKGTAAAAAVTGVAVASPGNTVIKALAAGQKNATASSGEQVFCGVCRANCFGGCFLNVHVRDGKVVRTSMREMPDPAYNRVCLKGLSHVQRTYDPNRLKYPMKRVGERGAGKWERISWDEAIDTITTKWKELQAKYGRDTIAFSKIAGSWGTLAFTYPFKLINYLGATAIYASMDAAFGYGCMNALGYGLFFNGNEPKDMANAKCIIIWGSNPTEAQIQNWHFIAEAKKNGAKIIVIDPNFTTSAAKADVYVSIKPGTDGALAMAMMNVAIKENYIDVPFIQKSSVGPFLIKESDGKYLRESDVGGNGKDFIVWDSAANKYGTSKTVASPAINGTYTINGIKVTTAYDLLLKSVEKYTPEEAEKVCGVPAETIREITRIYSQNSPSTLYFGYGLDHYVNGHYNFFAASALGIITGNVGKKGANVGLPFGMAGYFNPAANGNDPSAIPGPTIQSTRVPDIVKSGKIKDKPLTLKSLFIYSGNSLANFPNRKEWLEVINQMELVVVADMKMTDTTKYADIVLPVCHWFETEDTVGQIVQHPMLLLQEKAIEPLYESKSDFEIINLLATGMGLGDKFAQTSAQYMDITLDSPIAKAQGLTYKDLKDKKAIRWLPGDLFIHGEGGVFPTATGRAQFYQENPMTNFDYGQEIDYSKERLPYWEHPNEVYDENPLKEKYPLAMFQEHQRWRTHTQWGGSAAPWLREMDPEPTIKLNPADAAPREIKSGDIVKVFNDRGYVVIKAVLNDGVRPGMVNIPKGWEAEHFIGGHYQDLTSGVSSNVCANHPFFDVLVQVEKVKGGKA